MILLFSPAGLRADDTFVSKTQLYLDSDHTQVVSPLVRISKDTWKGGTVGAGFVADVVSSASVDVLTNATKHMSDFRREASASLSQRLASTTLSGAYIYSQENDYLSHNVALGLAQDLFQKNTTLGIGYTLSLNDVGRAGDPNFHRALDVHNVDATWTQLLSPKTLMQLSYTFQYAAGYQASPYRFVRIESAPDFKVPETDPDNRLRHAFVIAFKRHLFEDSAIHLDYRFYVDNWGVESHTVEAAYVIDWPTAQLRFRERFYYQQAASFFQSHYFGLGSYVTADRELSTFWSDLAGVKLIIKLDHWVRGLDLEAKADVFYFNYIDFAWLQSRVGTNLAAGLTLRF